MQSTYCSAAVNLTMIGSARAGAYAYAYAYAHACAYGLRRCNARSFLMLLVVRLREVVEVIYIEERRHMVIERRVEHKIMSLRMSLR